jgi:CubicO group peptidase (beta-lactamase class C family)
MGLCIKLFTLAILVGLLTIPLSIYLYSYAYPTTALSSFNLQRSYLGLPISPGDIQVKGECNYPILRSEFQKSFDEGREVGAQVAVYRHGKLVCSLWGGSGDFFEDAGVGMGIIVGEGEEEEKVCAKDGTCDNPQQQEGREKEQQFMKPLGKDTIMPIFSSGKVSESYVLSLLSDANKFEYADSLSKYWPDFGANGKDKVTVQDVMRHQAGLAVPDKALKMSDLKVTRKIDKVLATQHLNYADENGKSVALYHAVTRGLYANELVRRVDAGHRTIGAFFREEVARVYDLRFYLGINDDEWTKNSIAKSADPPVLFLLRYVPQYFVPWSRKIRRVLVGGDEHDTLRDNEASIPWNGIKKMFSTEGRRIARACLKAITGTIEGVSSLDDINTREFLGLELSSANALANAESMAKLGDVIRSRAQYKKDGWAKSVEPGEVQRDHGVNMDIAYTANGWGVDRFGPAGLDGWMGWAGASGSVFQWHEKYGLSFAYTTVLPYGRVGKPRGERLMKALVRGIGGWHK